MQQIRLFKGIESEVAALEQEVNDWLAETGVRVISIQANIAPQSHRTSDKPLSEDYGFVPSDVLMVVLYEAIAR